MGVIGRSNFGGRRLKARMAGLPMAISDGRPAGVTWDYDRLELIADGRMKSVPGAILIHATY
jgi:hypothetical protein